MQLEAPQIAGQAGRIAGCARDRIRHIWHTDDRRQTAGTDLLADAVQAGFDALWAEHLAVWLSYFSRSTISIPSARFQSFYEASLYHFKAMQNPVSGGLPVNNLRRTWSSHVFWDSYFIQRALLEANHVPEALEAIRFFQRTEAAAHRTLARVQL
jgi:trehalose/maltose hydrolase-like predicted phosphorylase